MDAASRTELEALRRRAFGPEADIHDDPAALERLIELEELARPGAAADDAPDDEAGDDAAGTGHGSPDGGTIDLSRIVEQAATPAAATESDADPSSGRRLAQRGTLIAGAAATVAIVAAVALAQPADAPAPGATPSPSPDASEHVVVAHPPAATLLRIRRDGAFGGYIELPTETEPPPFPASAALDWAVYLGDFFSWDLWIAGGTGDEADEHCILIRRDDDVRARCADAEGQRRGTLHVSLTGPDIPPEDLPAPMTEDDRIRFWWLDTGSIDVMLGPLADD